MPTVKTRGATLKHRTVQLLESRGLIVADVEQIIPHTFIRRDLFGLFDLLAIQPKVEPSDDPWKWFLGPCLIGVQVCSNSRAAGGGDFAAHKAKMIANPALSLWVSMPSCRAMIISWDKPTAARPTWRTREEVL